MDLSASPTRIPSLPTKLRMLVLVLLTVLQQLSTISAYTCSFTGHYHNGRLLCRHGTKSSSGVFDARRITILYLQEAEEEQPTITKEERQQQQQLESTSSSDTTVVEQDAVEHQNAHHRPPVTKREKLHHLLQHMRSVAPKLRICLPSFMARIKLIETKLEQENEIAVEANGEGSVTELDTEEPNKKVEMMEEEDRSATSASHVDLSGTWRPMVTPEFKAAYDQYLQNCSQSYLYRKVIVNGIALQKEIIAQLEDGKDLQITASNPAGNWNRTLVASSSQDPVHVSIKDPDGDVVQVEAWWEDSGTVHRSWLRNKARMMGGVFETARYLSPEDPNILLCDSIFHPSPEAPASKGFKYARVLWKFQREV